MSLYFPSESQYKKKAWYMLGAFIILIGLSTFLAFGSLGAIGVSLLLVTLLITPLLMNRYWFFLFIWLFISPAFDNLRLFLIAGANPVVFLLTGITVPVAFLLIGRECKKITQELPFVWFLLAFDLILTLNIFRSDAPAGVILEALKIFIEVFIIFCAYFEIKAGNEKRLFENINLFMIINASVALFQRVTGIGMGVVEGIARVGGLVGHPNCLAFVNAIYIPFGIYKIVNASSKRERSFWLLGVMLCVVTLFLTFCKNVIFAFLLQLGILFLFFPNRLKVKLLISLAVAVGLFLLVNFAFNLQFIEQFLSRMNNNKSLTWRFKIWGYLLSSITDSLIIGHGVNAAKGVLGTIDSKESSYVHNTYLQLLFDYGLSGFVFIAAFLQPSIVFIKKLINAPTKLKMYYTFPLLILLTIFMNMASDNSVFLRTPMGFAWVFLMFFYMPKNAPQTEQKPLNIQE